MKDYDHRIDIFKGLLTLGMIFCHALQFFSNFQKYPTAYYIAEFINIITFPGFVFCFGYTSGSAYFSKDLKTVWTKMLNAAFKTFAAFVISGISYRYFIDRRFLNLDLILNIITLSDIPGWSEFLVSFSLYSITAIVLFKPLKLISTNSRFFVIAFFILFFSSFIPYNFIRSTHLGLIIGTYEFASFPILQYMPFYIAGLYFQANKIRFNLKVLLLAGLMTTIATAYGFFISHGLPQRFPPSIFWLMLPVLVLYSYYIISMYFVKSRIITNLLQPIGQNSLVYLLLSNIFIFALKSNGGIGTTNLTEGFLLTLVLVLLITYILSITRNIPKRIQTSPVLSNTKI